jgi:LuxR family transcriptional regulator, maltose regulon positive regulatory protein
VTEAKDKVARGPRFPSSKFSVPRSGSRLVHRSRLFDELERGERARLTLVVGSPGAGKTALLADWVASPRSSHLRGSAVTLPTPTRSGLSPPSSKPSAGRRAVAALADDLEGAEGVGALVVDDFHLAGAAGADALALLVEYRPASLQLVVASRVDPPLRLHRMRANQELVELRDRDLSFSAEEAKAFLSGFGVRLSEPDLATVHRRSEGWAAGLQMVAISIQGSPDPAAAAAGVELHRHSVAGYFLDEVPETIDYVPLPPGRT